MFWCKSRVYNLRNWRKEVLRYILTAPRNLARLVTRTLLNLKVAAIDSTPHLLVLWGINLLFPLAGIPSACGWFVVVPVCCL
ncbi:hypothetical protein M758_12G148200, partial [Ceratodon purpureus]